MILQEPPQFAFQNIVPATYIHYEHVTKLVQTKTLHIQASNNAPSVTPSPIAEVPFYSQFQDITSVQWKKVGCGIASLAMIIEYYNPDTVSVNTLLSQAISSGAYQQKNGWIHSGLISLSQKYGLDGDSYDVSKLNNENAFSQLKAYLVDGPVMVSIHYKFDPKSTIPHLVVIDGVENGFVYYNDPAAKNGKLKISTKDFMKGWKKRFIVMRPVNNNSLV